MPNIIGGQRQGPTIQAKHGYVCSIVVFQGDRWMVTGDSSSGTRLLTRKCVSSQNAAARYWGLISRTTALKPPLWTPTAPKYSAPLPANDSSLPFHTLTLSVSDSPLMAIDLLPPRVIAVSDYPHRHLLKIPTDHIRVEGALPATPRK